MSTSIDRPMHRPLHRRLGAALLASSSLLGAIALAPQADASTLPAAIETDRSDTGVVDIDRDGVGDYGNYGVHNSGLNIGEQNSDGWNLRFVAPVTVTDAHRKAVTNGSKATLGFTLWHTQNLGDRKLVATALLANGLTGRNDFNREGIELFRSPVTPGRHAIDVSRAVAEAQGSTFVIRLALDKAPTKGDGVMTQARIATANASQGYRPTITFSAPTTATTAAPTTTVAPPTTTTVPQAATTTSTTALSAPAPVQLPAGMSLAFRDEFDGSSLNTKVWKPYHSTYGDGNKELQCHTPNNVAVSSGTLKIKAKRQTVTCPGGSTRKFTSGFLGTRDTGTYFTRYGRYEIRAKIPHGQGLWPAFWLRHRDGAPTAEVDIMEYFHSQVPGKSTATLHLDRRYNISKRTVPFEAPTANPGWHTWAVDIVPVSNGVKFTFELDGNDIHTFTDTQANWSRLHQGKDLFDMAINLSVGGNWVGHPDHALGYLADLNRCAQGGTPPNSCKSTGVRRASFDATYEVDYVRVFKKN